MAPGSRTRFFAYAICASLTAALGDVLVEAFQNAGAFGTTAIDANHQGVLPVLGLAAFLLVGLALSIARARFDLPRVATCDPLVDVACEIARSAVRVRLAAIVSSSLALVFLIEEYERGFGGGIPFDLARATPIDALASFAIYIACAIVVTLALGIVVRVLASTCDALVRIVTYFATLFERHVGDRVCDRARAYASFVPRAFFRRSGPFPDRAPPVSA